MGIAGLARRLEPHATPYSPEDLNGFSGIIDGPSLAYHAHKLALAAMSNVSRIPSYADINLQALRWLRALESVNIKVSTILFDGALPTTKQQERLTRTEKNNQQVKQLRSNYPSAACPIPARLGSTSYSFLAPTLREALSHSEYGPNTHVVPGEADDWCASCANEQSLSVIFSSDTDLLLYDYPREVRIVFLKDVELRPEPTFRGYSPARICRSMGLSSLVSFAYCLTQDPWKTDSKLAEEAKDVDVNSKAYRSFSRRYDVTPSIVDTAHSQPSTMSLQNLDVRISELVCQSLDTGKTPIVHLPLLVEDQHRSSAWNIGQDLRTASYSLVASSQSKVQECKRKAQNIAAQDIPLYSPEQLCSTVEAYTHSIKDWLEWTVDRHVPDEAVWPLFAIGLILPELKSPPKMTLLFRVLSADFDNTWDFVHITACLHAALYSLRFLKQCAGVWLSLRKEAPQRLTDNVKQLHTDLQSLGSIAALFCVPGQARKPIGDEEALRDLIAEVYASANIEVLLERKSNKKAKKQQSEAERKERRKQEANIQVGNNAFEMLAER